ILFCLLVRREASRAFDARVVKGGIQPPKCGQSLIHKRLHISLAADVRFDEQRLSASFVNGFHDRLSFALTPAGNNDLRSRFSQLEGSGLADARSSASNQSHLVFQRIIHILSFFFHSFFFFFFFFSFLFYVFFFLFLL